MKCETIEPLLALQKEIIGRFLTIAESSLHPMQFKAFKRMVFDTFHNEWKPRTIEILKKTDQVRAVPLTDNLDGKEDVMALDHGT